MARPLLPLTALLLLAAVLAPAAQAAPPRVGYTFTGSAGDRSASLPPGGVHQYNFTLTLTPATGHTKVDLEIGYSDFRSIYPAEIAPSASVSIRKASESSYHPLGIVSGFKGAAGYQNLTAKGQDGGEYKVQVTATLDPAVSVGEHPSHLGFTARDPDARASTATASYPFTFQVQPAANRAPTASFTVTATGLKVDVDASGSSDPDGDPLHYTWTFGDAEGAAGVEGLFAQHTYAGDANYTIVLNVTDGRGGSDEAARTVSVAATTTTTPPPSGGGGPTGALDSDGDGIPDADELAAGSDPRNRFSTPADRDGDGRPNDSDNCPGASNPTQADGDGDGLGDACDANLTDGPAADPDGDGKASGQDNCPAVANADQKDLDHDGRGDACDTDSDGDGVLDVADAFPHDAKESRDTDGDGVGNNADTDDDGDLLPDADEAARASDPLDRHDPPWLAYTASAVRRSDGANVVTWRAPADARLQRFLIWREASPYVLLAALPAYQGADHYEFVDAAPPPHARYHVQAQLGGMEALSYLAGDDRVTNWVTTGGAIDEGCAAGPDSDHDGLCDVLETLMGLDPADDDTDGDGLKDGDELLGTGGMPSLPNLADSDGDGVSDSAERKAGTDPLGTNAASTRTVEPKEGQRLPQWLWPTLILAGAIVLAALILRPRPKA